MRGREGQLEAALEAFEGADEESLGGFRMEVTIRAPTLRAAVELVSDSPLLNICEYLHPTQELTEDYQIRQKTFTKAEFVQNCKTMFTAGKNCHLFQGRDAGKVGKIEQQKITDLQAAFGWSLGHRKPTRWSTPNAWWIIVEAVGPGPLPEVNIARNKDEYLRFFDAIKGYLLCLDCKRAATLENPAFAKDGGKAQFRIVCKTCGKKRGVDECKKYFEHVIALGKIPVSVLEPWGIILGGEPDSVTESEEEFPEPARPFPSKRPRILAPETQPAPPVPAPPQRSQAARPSTQNQVRAQDLKYIPNFRQGGEVASVLPGITVSSIIVGDGNCQFAAFALHLLGDQRLHVEIRRTAVSTIGRSKELMEWCAQGDDHEGRVNYLREMSRTGVWGDEITICAVVKAFKVAVMVITIVRGRPTCSIYPAEARPPYIGLYYSGQRQHYEVAFPTVPQPLL
jgi:hypothetical protein